MSTLTENGTQMTLQEYAPEMFQTQMSTASDFHVRLSALLASEGDLKIQEALSSLRSCGLLKSDSLKYFSLKMLKGCSVMGGGTTFQTIICTMAELGYSCEWQVLNSKDFGVPQNRERLFLVGHLGGIGAGKVFPLATDYPKTDKLQGQQGIISNTIAAKRRDEVGIYPIISGGGYCSKRTEGQRLSQGLILKHGKKPRITDKAKTLDTRIGALPNFSETYVIEYEDQTSN